MSRNDGYTRYTVRIPTPLYERVKAAAGEASVNAEIVATLEEKYPAPPSDSASMLLAFFDYLAAKKPPANVMEVIDGIRHRLETAESPEEAHDIADTFLREVMNELGPTPDD